MLKNSKKLFSWKKEISIQKKFNFDGPDGRISYDLREAFSSSGKLQFLSGQRKAADYVKMLNDLSLAQEGRRLCGEE